MAEMSVAARTEKRCPRCETVKPATDFFRNCRDGLSPYCKPCSAARKRKGEKSMADRLAEVYPADGMKRCSKCGETKVIGDFSASKGKACRPQCKACQAKAFAAWATRQPKREPKPRGPRAWGLARDKWNITDKHRTCSACGERRPLDEFTRTASRCRACRCAYNAARYAASKKRHAQKRAAYKEQNLEKCKLWARVGSQKRRALKLQTVATLTSEQWEAILDKFGRRCLCCGSTENITMDHVVPLSKGGTHTADNVQPLCGPCNASKHTKIVDYRMAA